jgi:NAD(P)-dependent dehydrogenase (short-subunit alcohol dehydrogenase family)
MGADGRPATANMGGYLIAKFGLAGLLAVVAGEYPWLRVGSVAPGFTETAMLEAFDPRFLELLRTRRRFHTPDEIAGQILAVMQG